MAANAESPLDLLWKEYSLIFREFDDLTLARWLSQTLANLPEKAGGCLILCWARIDWGPNLVTNGKFG